jgi:putative transcriptional regulator
MKVVRSQFRIILGKKSQQEGRTISLREVVRTTGVPISTIMGLANNRLQRIGLDELGTLCRYFDCEVGELLKLEEVPDEQVNTA